MTSIPARRPFGFAIALMVLAVVGFVASFALTLDKLALLANPNESLSCNFSVLIGCGTNLNSAQGEIFGFPNSLLGLAFWAGSFTVGVAVIAGARFDQWFWMLFTSAVVAATALMAWFIIQSLFVLHVLCPWCMVTWAVTIPVFWLVILHVLRDGGIRAPSAIRRIAGTLYSWVPLITLACFVIVAGLAQWRLDVVGELAR